MAYNKLNVFYLALTEKECFRLRFELSFERFSLEARLPAGVRENEPALPFILYQSYNNTLITVVLAK